MKKYLLFLALSAISSTSFAQLTGDTHSFQLDENTVIYDKATGKRISYRDFNKMNGDNPYPALTPNIDAYGRISSLVYDPDDKEQRQYDRDESQRTKMGEKFPPFVLKALDGSALHSEEMAGKVIVLNFQLFMREPIVSSESLASFEKVISSPEVKNKIVPIIITQSPIEETRNFLQNMHLTASVVPNGGWFPTKYIITTFPSYIVVDAQGKLAGYTDDLDALKTLILQSR